jgi:mannose-1-phosphate guanylyltransferase / mannose-6-phosphate isomerase
MLHAMIMAGGGGTRFWPRSRQVRPKQFLRFSGDRTLLQGTVDRIAAQVPSERTWVLTSAQHRAEAVEQLRGMVPEAQVVGEPTGRDTAACIGLGAALVGRIDPDATLIVMPADHLIEPEQEFRRAVHAAEQFASDFPDRLLTFGIVPTFPATGYGYIRRGENLGKRQEIALSRVREFKEKPDAATAEGFVASGEYFWNSGIFVVRASTWLKALERFRPDIAAATRNAWDARQTDRAFVRPGKAEFAAIPAESVDYAVMEKATGAGTGFAVRMVPLDAGWSDLGAWDAVWQTGERNADGNAAHGDVLLEGSRNTLVHAASRLVAAVGVENLIVVETSDAVLVADRARSQDVKAVVGRLASGKRSESELHRRVHRPWGWYDSIDAGPRFQVKRIMVKPGAALSLQMHHHRAEHWVVVSGTAEVTCGDSKRLLTENQSTYIPLGEVHRLANPGSIPLEIIEVQSGSYLGEDDIVRFEDTYGRAG